MQLTKAQIELLDDIENGVYDHINQIKGHTKRSLRALRKKGVVLPNGSGEIVVDWDRASEGMPFDWESVPVPALTVLNFSGGKQSSALLWMVLLDEIEIDRNTFIVLNADPGMENSGTYEYVEMMFEKCRVAGIFCKTVDGPDLYQDMLALHETDADRFDNPPYWTKDEKGKMGRLRQKCTQVYKIAPMDRELRRILYDRYGISKKTKRMPEGLAEKWIGFSYDEAVRVKPSSQKYVAFRYPLIEKGMTNKDVIDFFNRNDLPIPPRSVCNACFANGLRTFYDMHQNRPQDWRQAVNVDNSVRDWSQIGVKEEIYVSNTLIPLQQLGEKFDEIGSEATDEELNMAVIDVEDELGDLENDYSCDSGYCFV